VFFVVIFASVVLFCDICKSALLFVVLIVKNSVKRSGLCQVRFGSSQSASEFSQVNDVMSKCKKATY
jgi:hypothetical protein